MELVIQGTAKEIAALVREIQERQDVAEYVMVRKPYSRRYSLVKADCVQESSREAK